MTSQSILFHHYYIYLERLFFVMNNKIASISLGSSQGCVRYNLQNKTKKFVSVLTSSTTQKKNYVKLTFSLQIRKKGKFPTMLIAYNNLRLFTRLACCLDVFPLLKSY